MSTSRAVVLIEEKTRVVLLSGTVKLKPPSRSVVVPMLVPFTTTVIFDKGAHLLSVTLPVNVRVWAISSTVNNSEQRISGSNFLIVVKFLILNDWSRLEEGLDKSVEAIPGEKNVKQPSCVKLFYEDHKMLIFASSRLT